MTLRERTLTIISFTFILLVAIIYFITQNVLLTNFTKAEESDTHQNVARVLSALSDDLSTLEAVTGNWAARDDTYAFIEDANEAYIASNLVNRTFTELSVNLMLFIDNSGKIVFGKAVDLENEEAIPVPPGLPEHLSNNDLLLTHPDTESITTGLILIPEGPMIVASHPILTSEDEGPIRGTLIMGRYLDAAEIKELAEVTHLSLTLHRFTDPQLPPDFQVARASVSAASPIFIQPLDEQSIAGYFLLKDIYGRPSLLLRADLPREIFLLGKYTLNFLMWVVIGVSLVLFMLTALLLVRQIASRLTHLNKSVSNISISGDLSTRISMTGNDELSHLGGSINKMLAVLQQSQDSLRGSEEKMQLTFDSMTDGVTVSDLDGNIVQLNEAVVTMHGYDSKEEIIGRSTFDLITEKDRTRATENLKRTLTDGYVKDIEYAFLTRDRREFAGELSAAVLKDASGNPTGFVGITKDITERKQSAKKLQELYNEERKLRRELEAEIAKRVEFTRALVHELKTPLTAVMASSELLATEGQEEPWLSLAKNIHRSASNLNERISELLDLARGEVGMLHLELRPIDPLQMLNSIFDDMRPVISMNKQSLITELPPALPYVTADEDRLRQVLLNLLDNATKFTPEGGSITLRAKEKEAFLIVEVQDTGRGITKEERERLFQPYHRLESDRERLSGLGLGLVLSKTIVELHGGQMWVESKPGKGSTFSFSIPLQAAGQSEDTGTGGNS